MHMYMYILVHVHVHACIVFSIVCEVLAISVHAYVYIYVLMYREIHSNTDIDKVLLRMIYGIVGSHGDAVLMLGSKGIPWWFVI